jgi:hypothetical protein
MVKTSVISVGLLIVLTHWPLAVVGQDRPTVAAVARSTSHTFFGIPFGTSKSETIKRLKSRGLKDQSSPNATGELPATNWFYDNGPFILVTYRIGKYSMSAKMEFEAGRLSHVHANQDGKDEGCKLQTIEELQKAVSQVGEYMAVQLRTLHGKETQLERKFSTPLNPGVVYTWLSDDAKIEATTYVMDGCNIGVDYAPVSNLSR